MVVNLLGGTAFILMGGFAVIYSFATGELPIGWPITRQRQPIMFWWCVGLYGVLAVVGAFIVSSVII